MNRIPILAGGAVLAAVVLCGGAVTVANAFSTAQPTSQVLTIPGVTTATSTSGPTASPSPSASATAEPGDDNGGVTVVPPSDPTKIDGKGCAHLGRHGADDPADHDATDDNHHDGENEPGHHEFLPGGGTQGGGTDDGDHHGDDSGDGSGSGSGGGSDDGSGHH